MSAGKVGGEISRQKFLTVSAAAAAVAGGVFGDRASGQDRNVVTFIGWGGTFQDYLREAYVKPFEKETGIRVLETTVPSLPKLKMMVEAKNVEVDVADGQGFVLTELGKRGYLEEIDYDAMGRDVVSNLSEGAAKKYGAGNYFGAECIGYRSDVFAGGTHPRTWAEFWDVTTFPGRRAMSGGERGIRPNLEFALLADGVPIDKLYPIDEERAWKSLKRIKPHVARWWTDSGLPAQLLVTKEVVLTTTYNSRLDAIKNQGHPVDVELKQAGNRMNYWVVPKGAVHRENAMRPIAFMMRPERQAHLSNAHSVGPTNRAAVNYIPSERLRDLPSSPENLMMLSLRRPASMRPRRRTAHATCRLGHADERRPAGTIRSRSMIGASTSRNEQPRTGMSRWHPDRIISPSRRARRPTPAAAASARRRGSALGAGRPGRRRGGAGAPPRTGGRPR
jgi:putative spermidine/putrescine transport system substrate-binding protein